MLDIIMSEMELEESRTYIARKVARGSLQSVRKAAFLPYRKRRD